MATVSLPFCMASHALLVHSPIASNAAVIVLAMVCEPAFTIFQASPAKSAILPATTETVFTMVSAPFSRKFHTASAHSPTFFFKATHAVTASSLMVSHPSFTFPIASEPSFTRPSQFAATVDTRPAVPAKIKPMPRGTLLPKIASMPRTIEAPLTKATTAPIGPFSFSSK